MLGQVIDYNTLNFELIKLWHLGPMDSSSRRQVLCRRISHAKQESVGTKCKS